MGSPKGRLLGKAVGLIAKAAEEGGIRDAVRAGEHGAAHTAEGAGTRAVAHDAVADAERKVVPLTEDASKQIADLPRGKRPDPASYLPQDYIEHHLAQFDDGATRFMSGDNLSKYGIAQRDGTSFVMAKREVDDLIARTGGDPRAMERELGLPEHFFDGGQIKRVDIDGPDGYGLRMPSGNEAGANEKWIPGGLLPAGVREAVIDGKNVPGDRIHVLDFP